ncbi:MAG: hypothetical protein ACREMQ_02460, partial [Longimicrobiales bacterium]
MIAVLIEEFGRSRERGVGIGPRVGVSPAQPHCEVVERAGRFEQLQRYLTTDRDVAVAVVFDVGGRPG